jgi:hypothetical protein
MAKFRMLSENFYNIHQFSGHTITASTYQVTNEPWRVGTGRRSARNAWIAPTTGTQTIKVECDQVRAADTVALDRGHNLTSFSVQFTNSTSAGWATAKTITLPSKSFPNQKLTEGARTPEGAYIVRFGTSTGMPAAKFWRLSCATTAGGNVKVVGAYLGKSFGPAANAVRPWDDDTIEMARSEVASPEFWTAGARVAIRRSGNLNVRLTDAEGDLARYHVRDLYWRGELAWITPNEDDAERTVLANAPSGTRALTYPEDWPTRVLALDWVEHQPKPR